MKSHKLVRVEKVIQWLKKNDRSGRLFVLPNMDGIEIVGYLNKDLCRPVIAELKLENDD